ETAFPGGWKPDPDQLRLLRAAACVVWAGLGATDPAGDWINPWRRRSAVRVTAAVRPAKVLLHAADEYGEVDAELVSAATASWSKSTRSPTPSRRPWLRET